MITNEWISGKDDCKVVFDIRKAVFGTANRDEFDAFAMHLVIYDSDIPVAVGRLFLGAGNVFYISHVGVLEKYRNMGLGDLTAKLLLYRGLNYTKKIYADIPADVEAFFLKYGFKKSDGIYVVLKDEVVYPSKCGKHKAE